MAKIAMHLLPGYRFTVLEKDLSRYRRDGPIVFFDDGVYSGEQMNQMFSDMWQNFVEQDNPGKDIEDYDFKKTSKIELVPVVAFITEKAVKIFRGFGRLKVIMIYGGLMQTAKQRLAQKGVSISKNDKNHLLRLFKFYTDKPFIYFDHKVPDFLSTSYLALVKPQKAIIYRYFEEQKMDKGDQIETEKCNQLIQLLKDKNWRVKIEELPDWFKSTVPFITGYPYIPPYKKATKKNLTEKKSE